MKRTTSNTNDMLSPPSKKRETVRIFCNNSFFFACSVRVFAWLYMESRKDAEYLMGRMMECLPPSRIETIRHLLFAHQHGIADWSYCENGIRDLLAPYPDLRLDFDIVMELHLNPSCL